MYLSQAVGSVNMTENSTEEQAEKDSYVMNPPLAHCLDVSADGLIAAVGLENTKVCDAMPTLPSFVDYRLWCKRYSSWFFVMLRTQSGHLAKFCSIFKT